MRRGPEIGTAHNPFSSHFVEPARGGFLFTSGGAADNAGCGELKCLPGVLDRLEAHGWRGELVGAHGAGKSTLLTDICGHLGERGLRVARWQCSDKNRWPAGVRWRELWQADVVAIDGAERLIPGGVMLVRWISWLTKRGLLITLHRKRGIGATVPVRADAEALARKVEALGAPGDVAASVKGRLAKHGGNAREVMFELYLEFEEGGGGE